MEPFGPPRLTTVEPAGDLGSLLAIDRDEGIPLRSCPFLNIEEWLTVDHRQEDGEEPRRLPMPEDGHGRIAGVHLLPLPKDGDRPRLTRNRLDLPGTGKL